MRTGWMPLWVIPAIIALAIGTVWLRLTVIRTTYEINQTDRQLAVLQQEREQVHLRLANLRSPRRLETLARTKFGLSHPQSDQVVYLK
jgi:cell division protein FtsL